MSGNSMLALVLLLPVALSMKLDGSSDVDAPHHSMMLSGVASKVTEFSKMGAAFARSEATHRQSMNAISQSLTLPKAMAALQRSTLPNISTSLATFSSLLGSKNLRRGEADGFGGLDGARRLLNDMIFETMTKYDAEIAKCTAYYAQQCALMEVARGQISAANFVAATARALILDAQNNIDNCEKDVPVTKEELKGHNRKCKDELKAMDNRLKIIMQDIAVMTMILKMSDCDAKGLVQMRKLAMLRCENGCTNTSTITFNHNALQKQVNQLKSPGTKDLMAETFADLFEGGSMGSFVQVAGSEYQAVVDGQGPDDMPMDDMPSGGPTYVEAAIKKAGYAKAELGQYASEIEVESMCNTDDACLGYWVDGEGKMTILKKGDEDFAKGAPSKRVKSVMQKVTEAANTKKTEFNRPPVPRTKVPSNPCTDPDKGAPSAANKRAAKCTLKKSPRCYKLQGRFLQIQAGIEDSRDELMAEIQKLEDACADTKATLEASIDNDRSLLSSSQTKLATATEKEATAGETGRQVAKENEQYNADLVKQMKTCSTNYIDFETELCALRKIRGDLFKKMKPGHPGYFGDCLVSPWAPEACTKVCAGGEQKLIRGVLTKAEGGAKCLPLAAEKNCNLQPCPVDCHLAAWGGWAKCSSKCGGGMEQRTRDVKQPMQYNGKPCSPTTESRQCNVAACEKNCVLHPWTKWTDCTKDCDGGSAKRERTIKEPAEGAGKCADKWSEGRLQYKDCHTQRCRVEDPNAAIKCNQTLDVVLLLDATPKSGKEGWASEVKAANIFVDAFQGPGITAGAQFAIIHFSGPRTWSGVSKCTGDSKEKVDIPKQCHVKIAGHFESDMTKVKATINGLKFKPGAKLLSLGLMTVTAEMALGRPDARSIVVVFMDGEPLSYRKTRLASREIRKKARLVYVIVNKFAPLANIKLWATRRWQENIVAVDSAKDLEKAEVGTHIVANICPKKFPKLKTKRPDF